MTEFTREMCKNDPEVLGKLFDAVKKIHKPADHTEKVLLDNKHIKDFCEEARHYVVMGSLFIHYDVASWYKHPNQVQIRIDSIGVYDDFMEYEKHRMFNLHKAQNKNIPNIN